jgi:UDP-N-acetylmuramyl pentapeptide phosphotransferase/UDP-N-acetylglucosamine-1-phosphate transferase
MMIEVGKFGQLFILVPVVISWFINFVLLRLNRKNFLDVNEKSHAIHEEPVPRIGGISIFISFLLTGFLISDSFFIKVLLPVILVFGLGLIEDLRKDIPPKLRLMFLLFVSAFTMLLLGIKIDTIGFFRLPLFIAIPLTLIAIAGFTNAINIIDGLNGLASGVSAIFLFFLGLAFYEYGYSDIALICFVIIGGVLGFLMFNFPYGKIFLGDGGAYFLGFMCAVLSIKLINLIPEISPWFPFILGIYPVWEVLFSAYRRKKKNRHPFYPDKLHFHTLIYYRLTRSNPKASILIVAGTFVFSLIAFLVKACTTCLVLEFFVFIVIYLTIYERLVGVSRR